MAAKKREESIVLEVVRQLGGHDGVDELILATNVGDITARYHEAQGAETAVLWVGGAGVVWMDRRGACTRGSRSN